MKPVTPAYLDMIQTQQRSLYGHLFTFTLAGGAQDFITDLDVDVNVNAVGYRSGGLRIEGMKLKIAVGLEVDEQDVKISVLPDDTLCGANFLESVADGALDGAWLARDRAIWAVHSGNPLNDILGYAPIQVTRMFFGRVSEITKIGRTFVEMKVKSPLVLLDLDMPRNIWGPGCNWTLFDQGCTMVKARFGYTGSVGAGTYINTIQWQGGVPIEIGADHYEFFAQGRVLFTSGPLNGTQFFVRDNNDQYLVVLGMVDLPNVGDTFTAYAGCSKTMFSCLNKFGNLQNYRGFPFVPPVMVGI